MAHTTSKKSAKSKRDGGEEKFKGMCREEMKSTKLRRFSKTSQDGKKFLESDLFRSSEPTQENSSSCSKSSRITKILAPKADMGARSRRTHPAETRRQRELQRLMPRSGAREERKACYEVYPLSSPSTSFYHPTNERTVWEVLLHHPFTEICIAFMLVPMSTLTLALQCYKMLHFSATVQQVTENREGIIENQVLLQFRGQIIDEFQS
ncbi:unnamed protein product [Brugia pahangi]|uniref:V-type proton ATPase subunit a n=1 Tax=Brugia pahangi TaxID=6280 RepID=A0A158PQ37_BRUPA|nr:unnamed protein product [Brugia pahangi]